MVYGKQTQKYLKQLFLTSLTKLITMRKSILVVVMLASLTKISANTYSQFSAVNDYISQYLNIASFESIRSGIPTSIILAQGILESQCGNSLLATRANNHFGIKWKSAKDGNFFTMMDDDKNSKGHAIASKFIVYSSVEESYRHHTDFLVQNERYKRLFAFDRTDYRNWAKGLSECTYATDKEYAQKLIQSIERYQLNQYDIPSVLSLEEEENNNVPEVAPQYQQLTPNYNVPRSNIPEPQKIKVSYARVEEIIKDNDTEESELFEIVGETWETKNPTPQNTHKTVKSSKNTYKKPVASAKTSQAKKTVKKSNAK